MIRWSFGQVVRKIMLLGQMDGSGVGKLAGRGPGGIGERGVLRDVGTKVAGLCSSRRPC